MEEILKTGFPALGLSLTEEGLTQFRRYFTYLDTQNRVMNLTAIVGEEETALLHFLDCAALLRVADFRGKSVIDVGTGAGFPGLPLKIAEPTISLTLLDSQGKRINFLEESVRLLGLEDVKTVLCRAEEAPKELREHFDIATARAVTRMELLSELCLPFVKVGGLFVAMKGSEPERELEQAETAIRVLGGAVRDTVRYTVPGTDVCHSAVVIEKTAPTPEKYPRRWAKMQKEAIR